jgi:signal transduction histidine kinase
VKGTGLGLYLSRYFIEAHRGTVSIQSAPATGTKIIVRLPMNLKETQKFPGLTTHSKKSKEKQNYA